MRASPAISFGDSILQMASIVRCVSLTVTARSHHLLWKNGKVRRIRTRRPELPIYGTTD
jgi:hypothetical protein